MTVSWQVSYWKEYYIAYIDSLFKLSNLHEQLKSCLEQLKCFNTLSRENPLGNHYHLKAEYTQLLQANDSHA